MKSNFFAMVFRMRYITRWGLARNIKNESVCEHSLDVAVIAHALALLCNKKLGSKFDPGYVALVGMYHDASEILTGDLPTTIKYKNPEICKEYKKIEKLATEKLINMLPKELQMEYKLILDPRDEEVLRLVKEADKFAALIKCIEENKSGNAEFVNFEKKLTNELKSLDRPEVDMFLEEFIPAYKLSLDNQEFLRNLEI